MLDTGIANEKDMGINLLTEDVNESGINEDGVEKSERNSQGDSWWETWWESYDAKGSTEKGANKYGRLNEQSWWEKWGEHYDGRGSVLKWTDKWAETKIGTKWGDKWEEKFFGGVGSRQGETWHVTPAGERWSRTWGEEHFGNKAEPYYGWADVVGDSTQLLSIQPQEKSLGGYPYPDFRSFPPPPQGRDPPSMPPRNQ
ncbi:unnamed protein product [Lactuca saligna]|uniref:Uncharacterized protein n=1 Tax=Lactuca saligna TaxID=75948 RepID=A0AA35V4Q1_LACSI|nr:unnamed protein product [Lactuca saligna]